MEITDLIANLQEQGTIFTLSLEDMMASSPICLLSKDSKTKYWPWRRRLSHFNFGAINHLARHGIARGLPKLKFEKDHLCFACAMGKSKKKPHKPKSEDTNQEKLYVLHMNLCSSMCVASVNGKNENLGKLQPKADIGYAPTKKALRIYNRRTRRINKTIHVDFDELTVMASEHSSSEPTLHEITPTTISLGLVPNPPSSTPFVIPSRTNWDLLFQQLFDELLTSLPSLDNPSPKVITLIAEVTPVTSNDVEEDNHQLDIAHMHSNPFFGVEESLKTPTFHDDLLHESLHDDLTSQGSSSNMRQTHTPFRINTPLVEKCKLDEDLQGNPVDATLYHDMIGSLMYLTSSRPDLTYAGTINMGLWYSNDTGDKLVSWSSKKQKCTASSSTKAEYIPLSGFYAQTLWMRSQLTDYVFQFNKIPLYCDNKSAISLCCNYVKHSRAKHIDYLTNQAMLESEAYKTYHAYATGEKTPKCKYVQKKADSDTSPKMKSIQAPKGDDDQDDDNEQTESDNDGDDFLHLKLITFDKEERHDEKKDEEEEGSNLRVQTPSHFESTDDEAYDDLTQGVNVEKEKLDEDMTNKEEVDELYNGVNINLEGRDTEMIDASLTNVQATQVIENTHVIMTVITLEAQQPSSYVSSGFISNMLNPNSNTGIDSILNLNIESTSLVDVPVTINLKMPPSSVITLPPPPIPLIQPQQQTPVPPPAVIPIYKATTDQLDWNNPEGWQYLHDLRKPLPLIANSQDHRVIPFDHFINNDLAYLRGGALSQTYATSMTKTKAADYEHIKWLKDLVPSTMWSLNMLSMMNPIHMCLKDSILQAGNPVKEILLKLNLPDHSLDGDDDDDDYDNESIISTNTNIFETPSFDVITTSPLVLPTEDLKDSLIMGNKELNTIPEKKSDEFIDVEDLIPILSESEDTSGSDGECILLSCDDFSPNDIPEEKSVTFSNPLFNSNDDFIFSDDESLSDEDVPKYNVKISSNPLFEFDDEYIYSDANPLFDKVLENIESKDSYDSNLDEPDLLVTPLFDSNKDEYFTPGDDVELLLHHDLSIPKMSVASILEGFTDKLPLEENDDFV
nr:hypothetical protein [Tanacetum cinerariifolium]